MLACLQQSNHQLYVQLLRSLLSYVDFEQGLAQVLATGVCW